MNPQPQTWDTPSVLISICALAVSLSLAGWQILRYFLDGGRVRVRLRPALLVQEDRLHDRRTWREVLADKPDWGWTFEAAVVEVENLGRTAVTFNLPVIDLGRRRKLGWRRRTLAASFIPVAHSCQESPRRLEPFDSVFYVFDPWWSLAPSSGARERPERPFRVRVSIRVAGKRTARRSAWHLGWKVKDGQGAFLPELVEPGTLAFRSIWRHTRGDDFGRMAAIPTAIEMRDLFPLDGPAPSTTELQRLLDANYHNHSDYKPTVLAAAFAAKELALFYALPPADDPSSPQP